MKHRPGELCAELSDQLPDYLHGEAKEAICREIEAHLAECQDCRIVIDTIKKTIALFHAAPREEVPGDVHQRLVKMLNLEQLHKPGSKPLRRRIYTVVLEFDYGIDGE